MVDCVGRSLLGKVCVCVGEGQLTVPDADLALAVLCPQHGLARAPLLDHGAHRALCVWAVIRWILTQL